MHANSLTLPFPSGSLPRHERSEAPSGRSLGAMLRSLRIPRFPPTAVDGASRPNDLAALRAEKRLSRMASRGQQIKLGTPALPYEPLVLGGAPLVALKRFDGLTITITTRSSEIREQIALLVELDLRHAVAVDMMVASLEPESTDLGERLRAVSDLASHGITSRVLLTDLPGLPLSGSPLHESAMAGIHRLFGAAKHHRAVDVSAVIEHGVESEWPSLLRYLRLEHGFPRALPGRG